jgi:serine phosphatase RsbU (regulator of sigma subunit)
VTLEAERYTTIEAEDGIEALDRFMKRRGSAHAILNAIQQKIRESELRRRQHPRSANQLPARKVMKQYNELMIRSLEEKSIELEQTRDELRELNQELEQRVAERTRDGKRTSSFRASTIRRDRCTGDFFTVSRRSDTAVDGLIADVMGHGVRAGLITAMMRVLVEKFSAKCADPVANPLRECRLSQGGAPASPVAIG